MLNKRTKFLVGLFVASGVALAVVALIWLGMSNLFSEGTRYAVYFDESVQGLNVDAPVKYRGVTSGRVIRIAVAPDSQLIEVVLEIDSGITPNQDMVAELKVVGITGNMFIELDHLRGDAAPDTPNLSFPTPYPVIHARPSDIKKLFHGIDEIVEKLNAIDIPGISDRFKMVLDHLDQGIVAADIPGIAAKAHGTVDQFSQAMTAADIPRLSQDLQETLRRLNQNLRDLEESNATGKLTQAIDSLNSDLDPQRWSRIMASLEQNLTTLQAVMAEGIPLLQQASGTMGAAESGIGSIARPLMATSQNLERASANLRALLDTLNQHPSRLLFDTPPTDRPVEGQPLRKE